VNDMGIMGKKIPNYIINDFMAVCRSEKDDSQRCRQIIGQLQAENEKQAERIKKLEEALKQYGKHKKSCLTNFIDSSIDSTCNTHHRKCTCGFEQALKGE